MRGQCLQSDAEVARLIALYHPADKTNVTPCPRARLDPTYHAFKPKKLYVCVCVRIYLFISIKGFSVCVLFFSLLVIKLKPLAEEIAFER